ncbi:MAG: hypothetical protein LBL56_00390, partial [Treponema sp.]|nr:hypothetical protein [Treponema sp.]
TLVVPGLNDSDAELERCTEFIAALEAEPVRQGNDPAEPVKKGPATIAAVGPAAKRPVPWHLSAYHPSYRWDAPPTDSAALLRLAERARKTLPYVYTGNIAGEKNDTPCPHCGAVLVRRRAYRVESRILPVLPGAKPTPEAPETAEGPAAKAPRPCRCASCGGAVPVYW